MTDGTAAGTDFGARSDAGDRASRARLAIALLAMALGLVALLSLAWGAADVSAASLAGDALGWLAGHGDSLDAREKLIVYDIRLPRIVMGALVGASLAVSGAVMQALFRNPLADPGLIGISAGAGLGAVAAIVLGTTLLAPLAALLGSFLLPLAAFAGGLAATSTLYQLATRQGRTSVATMLLAGIALAALAMALTGLLIFAADDRQLRDLTFWQLGSLAGATWPKVGATAPAMLTMIVLAPLIGRGLNALALGEAAAGHLGVSVQRLKYLAIVGVSISVGACVAVSGGIGFVGIVVPHVLRLAIGPDNRTLLPAAALLGATLLLVADALARTVVAPAELPIGIVTALAGAPFFLWILLRRRGIVDL